MVVKKSAGMNPQGGGNLVYGLCRGKPLPGLHVPDVGSAHADGLRQLFLGEPRPLAIELQILDKGFSNSHGSNHAAFPLIILSTKKHFKYNILQNTKIDNNAFNECPVQIEWRE